MFTQIGVIKIDNHNRFNRYWKYGNYPLLAYVDPSGVVIKETIHAHLIEYKTGKSEKHRFSHLFSGFHNRYKNDNVDQIKDGYACLGEYFTVRHKWLINSRQHSHEKVNIIKK